MAGNGRRRATELLKSALIVLLTLSALGLLSRAQADSGMPSLENRLTELWQDLTGGASADTQNGQTALSAGLRPVRMAVSNENGRYGIQYEAELADTVFEDKLGALLGDALAGASAPSEVPEESWRAALAAKGPSVYYDFLGSVPLSALSAWLGGEENAALTGQARRILLAPDADGAVMLYYCGVDGLFYACRTDLSADLRLQAETADYTPNQAVFAFEQQERYPNLDPYVMVLSDTPQPSIYQASNPIGPDIGDDTLNQLLKALDFHPQTSSVYQDAAGLVVREGTDTLRISDAGVVNYHAASGEDPRYPVSSENGLTGLGAMVETARALCWNGLGQWCGSAGLYLMGTEQQDDGATAVYFGYLLDGAAVELYEDGYAARVVIRDGYVSDFTLRLRSYQKTENYSAVLPEIQAAAAMQALQAEENELLLCYLDGGGSQQIAAGWIAR